jgi:RNA polymerase sigma-70 factor (ECF subfamily)
MAENDGSSESPGDVQVLVRRAREGDSEAIDSLYREIYPVILQTVRHRLGPALRKRLDSLDVAQSVLFDLFRGLASGPIDELQGKPFLVWLFAVIENKIRNKAAFHTAQKRDMRKEVAVETESGFPDVDVSPIEELLAKEVRSRLALALQRLPEHYREVILYRNHLELPWKDIGERIGKSEAAAKMLFQRALAQLREHFDDTWS